MEKGKIIVSKTKRGYAGALVYTKKNGKPGKLPISVYRFKDNKYNDKDCEYELEKGVIKRLVIGDKTIFPESQTRPGTAQRGSRPNKHISNMASRGNDILDLNKVFLPADTRATLVASQIDNPHLKYNKLVHDVSLNANTGNLGERSGKNTFEQYRKNRDTSKAVTLNFSKAKFNDLCARQEQYVEAICNDTYKFSTSTSERLLIGMGEESVLELNLKLHYTYGFPYIPASSVKGAVRSYIIAKLFGENAAPEIEKYEPLINAEYRALQNSEFCTIFGASVKIKQVIFEFDNKLGIHKPVETENGYKTNLVKTATKSGEAERGRVLFFDTIPSNEPKVEFDVMTPHYGDYYGKDKLPTDTGNPNPIPFLSVAENTHFDFYFGVSKGFVSDLYIQDSKFEDLFIEALVKQGVGAKTAIGYGRMNDK